MSGKVVVQVCVEGDEVQITAKDGRVTRQPLTEKVARKMDGLGIGYFYAKPTGNGYTLLRFGPWAEWAN